MGDVHEGVTTVGDNATVEHAATGARMKVAILAGGLGSRISEETEVKPKPMVEIGGRPILWHIMKHYAHYGLDDFVDRARLQGRVHQALHGRLLLAARRPDRVAAATGRSAPQRQRERQPTADDWTVDLVDTGQDTATGGRIKRLAPYLGDETFMLTWGDGVVEHRPRRAARVPPRARQARDGDGGAPAGALRPPRARGRPGHGVLREAADRRGLDQRRVLRARARGLRLHRRRRHAVRARAARAARARRPADGLPARRPSGSAWTRCATRSCWRSCGRTARPGEIWR